MITIKKVATAEQDSRRQRHSERPLAPTRAARWMYPDSQQYWEHFPSFVKAFAGPPSSMAAPILWTAIRPQRFGFLRAFIRTKKPSLN